MGMQNGWDLCDATYQGEVTAILLVMDVFEVNCIRVCTNGQGIMHGTMELKIGMNEERVKEFSECNPKNFNSIIFRQGKVWMELMEQVWQQTQGMEEYEGRWSVLRELKEADVSYSWDCVKCCTPSSLSSHSFCKSLSLTARSKHPDPSGYKGETGEI